MTTRLAKSDLLARFDMLRSIYLDFNNLLKTWASMKMNWHFTMHWPSMRVLCMNLATTH